MRNLSTSLWHRVADEARAIAACADRGQVRSSVALQNSNNQHVRHQRPAPKVRSNSAEQMIPFCPLLLSSVLSESFPIGSVS